MIDEVDSILIDEARTPLIISSRIGFERILQNNVEGCFPLGKGPGLHSG
jgi:preprotein translocase subunit SecA